MQPDPTPILDPVVLAAEYLELNCRWRDGSPLSMAELSRWRELRELLDKLLDGTPPPGHDKRRFLRVPTRLDMEFSEGADRGKGVLAEIGEGGLFVATGQPFERGTPIRLEIMRQSKAHPLVVAGTVVWARQAPSSAGPPGMGVRFAHLDGGQSRAINDIIERALLLVLSRSDHGGT